MEDIYVNKFESVIFAKQLCILQSRTYIMQIEINFEGLEMQEWSGVIHLVMFAHEVIVTKM